MAITSLVTSVLFAPLGIVFGHIALGQLKRNREQGRGLAIAGLVIGYTLTVVSVVSIIAVTVFVSSVVDTVNKESAAGQGAVRGGEAAASSPSRDTQIGYGEAKLEPQRSASISDLRGMGFEVNPDYSENASDRGLVDGFFVDIYSAWKIGAMNKAEGDRVLSAVIDPDTDDYARYKDMIGVGNSPILANVSFIADDSTGNVYNKNFDGADGQRIADSNGNAMRVLTLMYNEIPNSSDPGIINQVVYQRAEGRTASGKRIQKWVIRDMAASSSPSYWGNLREAAFR